MARRMLASSMCAYQSLPVLNRPPSFRLRSIVVSFRSGLLCDCLYLYSILLKQEKQIIFAQKFSLVL